MRKSTLILFFIFLVLAIIFFFNFYTLQKRQESLSSAILRIDERKIPAVNIPKTIYNLAGEVKKIGENYIVFSAIIHQLDKDGNLTQSTEERNAKIIPATKFSRLFFVSQEGTEGKSPKEESIVIEDIAEGDYVEVISNRDIAKEKEFEASQVRLLQKKG